MMEIMIGFTAGVLVTCVSRVGITWRNHNSNPHNVMDATRYKQLIEKTYGQLYGQESLTTSEYDELHHIMSNKRRFYHSRFGRLKTNAALIEIRFVVRQELEESRINIGIFMDQWMDEMKKTFVSTPQTYEGTEASDESM